MTDDEVMAELRSDSSLNKARREFSFACARIEQAGQQRTPLSPINMRRMEFEAVLKIVTAFNDGWMPLKESSGVPIKGVIDRK